MIQKIKSIQTNLKSSNNIYNISNWQIFKKNLLAGFARSIGSWIFNLIFLALLAYILIPLFGSAKDRLVKSLPKDLNEIIIQIEKR